MYTNTKFGKSILPKVSGTNMCFWKAYCPIAGKIILIILVGTVAGVLFIAFDYVLEI